LPRSPLMALHTWSSCSRSTTARCRRCLVKPRCPFLARPPTSALTRTVRALQMQPDILPRPSLSPLCFTPFVALLLPSLCFLLEQRANAFAAAAGAKSCPQVAQSTATDDAAKGFTLGAVTRAHATVAHVWQLRRRFTAAHVRGLPFRRTCGSPVCCPPFLPAPFIPARTPGQKTVFFCLS
jgi:hypothetical protein